jgi:hypothetical protein
MSLSAKRLPTTATRIFWNYVNAATQPKIRSCGAHGLGLSFTKSGEMRMGFEYLVG